MRSLNYMLFSIPENLDDYIDLSRKEKPLKITINLVTDELLNTRCLVKRLIAEFQWEFKGYQMRFEKVIGACFSSDSQQKQKLSIEKANKKLQRYFGIINELGVPVIGLEKASIPTPSLVLLSETVGSAEVLQQTPF